MSRAGQRMWGNRGRPRSRAPRPSPRCKLVSSRAWMVELVREHERERRSLCTTASRGAVGHGTSLDRGMVRSRFPTSQYQNNLHNKIRIRATLGLLHDIWTRAGRLRVIHRREIAVSALPGSDRSRSPSSRNGSLTGEAPRGTNLSRDIVKTGHPVILHHHHLAFCLKNV